MAYFYQKGNIGSWPSEPSLTVPDPLATYADGFGWSVISTGNSIFIDDLDANFNASNGTLAGTEYIYAG